MWAMAPPPLSATRPSLSNSWRPSLAKFRRFDSFRVNASSMSDYPLASRILVKNIPYYFGESSLRKEFSSFGDIAEVNVIKDKETKMSKGFAFIQYTCQDDALLALETMDRQELDGRMIYVELSKLRKDSFRGSPRTCGPPTPKETISGSADDDEKVETGKIDIWSSNVNQTTNTIRD